MISPHDSDVGYILLRASKHIASKMSRPATASPNDTAYFWPFDQAAVLVRRQWSHLNQAEEQDRSSSTCVDIAVRSERPQTRKSHAIVRWPRVHPK